MQTPTSSAIGQTEKTADSKTAVHSVAPENKEVRSARVESVHRKSQSAALLRLLIEAQGSWVSLPEILKLGIAQYNARILELRRMGFLIENRTSRVNGARHSWFRLVSGVPLWDVQTGKG